jgi:hypothetical protein
MVKNSMNNQHKNCNNRDINQYIGIQEENPIFKAYINVINKKIKSNFIISEINEIYYISIFFIYSFIN